MDNSNSAADSFPGFVAAFIEACNVRVKLIECDGKIPLYRDFEATIGPKYARISCPKNGVRAFIDRDCNVRQAKSWKQVGRIIGKASECFDYVVEPHMALKPR